MVAREVILTRDLEHLAIDSASQVIGCPREFGRKQGRELPKGKLTLCGAGGEPIPYYGRRWLRLRTGGKILDVVFEVGAFTRVVVGVDPLIELGFVVSLSRRPTIQWPNDSRLMPLVRKDRLFLLHVDGFEPIASDEMPPTCSDVSTGRCIVMPADAVAMQEDGDGTQEAQEEEEEMPGVPRYEEKTIPKSIVTPVLPDLATRRQHELVHLPFAAWCEICVRTKSHDDPHCASEPSVGRPVEECEVIQLDYTFVGPITILAVYNCQQAAGSGTPVESKGTLALPYVIQWMKTWLHTVGVNEAFVQCDKESAAKQIAKAAAELSGFRLRYREAPEKSSQSMGAVGRFQRALQEQLRAEHTQLEEHLGTLVPADWTIILWLVKYASWQLFRYQSMRGHVGIPFVRVRGHLYDVRIMNFAERDMALIQAESKGYGPRRNSKFYNRWIVGHWLGKSELSDEHIKVYTD